VEDKGHVRPVAVKTGITDGTVTEIVKGDLEEGTAVIVGVQAPPREQPRQGRRPLKQDDTLLVQPWPWGLGERLPAADAEAIARECPSVRCAAPVVRARKQIVYGKHSWVPVYIYGSTPEYLEAHDWQALAEGDAFTDRDVRATARVCLVGQTVVRELFEGESPVGKQVRVGDVPLRVIGVLAPKGANWIGLDTDDIVLAPWTTIQREVGRFGNTAGVEQLAQAANSRYPGGRTDLYGTPLAARPSEVGPSGMDQILVRAESREAAARAREEVVELLRRRHRLGEGQADDFSIRE
jgi:hypothetical protein